jgi:CubicO group peptidase (beta-lactamase class C family)
MLVMRAQAGKKRMVSGGDARGLTVRGVCRVSSGVARRCDAPCSRDRDGGREREERRKKTKKVPVAGGVADTMWLYVAGEWLEIATTPSRSGLHVSR